VFLLSHRLLISLCTSCPCFSLDKPRFQFVAGAELLSPYSSGSCDFPHLIVIVADEE
jgi:hypothetical protein